MTVETKLVEIPEDGSSISATALIKGKSGSNQSTNFYNGKVSFYTDQIINQLGSDDTITIADASTSLQLIGATTDQNGDPVPGSGFLPANIIQFVCYQLNNEGNDVSLIDPIPGKTNANPNFHFAGGYPINTSDGMPSFGMKFTVVESSYFQTGRIYIKFSCTKRQDPQSAPIYQWGILEFMDANGLMTVTFNWIQ